MHLFAREREKECKTTAVREKGAGAAAGRGTIVNCTVATATSRNFLLKGFSHLVDYEYILISNPPKGVNFNFFGDHKGSRWYDSGPWSDPDRGPESNVKSFFVIPGTDSESDPIQSGIITSKNVLWSQPTLDPVPESDFQSFGDS